jgi:Holliday junction resolvase RusA-like endonuclease
MLRVLRATISLELQGKPEAQPRPGNARGQNARFDPKKKEKDATKVLLKSVVDTITAPGETLFDTNAKLIVTCLFFLRRPRTDLKNNRDGRLRLRFPIINLAQFFVKKKTDVDNLAKFSLDCMTGVVYDDDMQVHVLKVAKCYDAMTTSVRGVQKS